MATVNSAMLLVPKAWMKPKCSVRSPSGDWITAPQAHGPGLVGAQAPSHQIFQLLKVLLLLQSRTPVPGHQYNESKARHNPPREKPARN